MRAAAERRGADANRTFELINEVLPYAPYLLRPAHRLFSGGMSAGDRVRWSHEILPSPRTTRFNEMEYAVPYAKGPETIKAIVGEIRKKRINTGFPIEYRTVAADDVWLSPFYQRKSATIAVHQYHRVNTARLFDMCESIFRSVEGRPHWGKRHTRTREEMSKLYPKFEDFRARARKKLDPEGMKFLNPHLRAIFEGNLLRGKDAETVPLHDLRVLRCVALVAAARSDWLWATILGAGILTFALMAHAYPRHRSAGRSPPRSHPAPQGLQVVDLRLAVEATRRAGVAGRADLVDLHQQHVAVAVDPGFDEALRVTGLLALAPHLLARTRPVGDLAGRRVCAAAFRGSSRRTSGLRRSAHAARSRAPARRR